MKIYGISINGETMYSDNPAVIVCEAFANTDCNIDFSKAIKDIELLENVSISERNRLREQGLMRDYYSKNNKFHLWHGIVRNLRPGTTRQFKYNPDYEFCCKEMAEKDFYQLPEYN